MSDELRRLKERERRAEADFLDATVDLDNAAGEHRSAQIAYEETRIIWRDARMAWLNAQLGENA